MTKKEFEDIYRQHYARMYRLARTMLYDADESKDVVSDIFARLLRDGDRPQKDRMEGYLMTAVRNRCRDVLNRKSMQERVEKHFLQESADLPTAVSQRDELRGSGTGRGCEQSDGLQPSVTVGTANQGILSATNSKTINVMEKQDRIDQLVAENQELLALTKQAFVIS